MKKLTFKIWILIIVLAFSLISIFGIPPKALQQGVVISSVESDSLSFEAGLRQEQIITAIDGEKNN